jgi:hypothetical protein
MPAELSRETIAELDALEPSEVTEITMGYLARRHRLLMVPSAKLVVVFDEGRFRKAYLELGLSPKQFDLNAPDL